MGFLLENNMTATYNELVTLDICDETLDCFVSYWYYPEEAADEFNAYRPEEYDLNYLYTVVDNEDVDISDLLNLPLVRNDIRGQIKDNENDK